MSDDERSASSTSSGLVHRCFTENQFDCHQYLHALHESKLERRIEMQRMQHQTKSKELAELKQRKGAAEVDGDILFDEQDATRLVNVHTKIERRIEMQRMQHQTKLEELGDILFDEQNATRLVDI
jgi:hypothetical protein